MLTKQEMVSNFILNVEKERIRQNLTQAQMAKKLDMSLSGYKKMVSGVTTKIDLYTAYLLYNMTGKWIFELIDDSPEDADIIRNLRKLSPRQKNFIKGIIDFEIAFSDSHKEEPEEDYITVFVPTGNMEDGMIYDSSNYFKMNASSYRRKFGNDLYCGIQVTSDHFHPVYNLGDILLICHKAIREGDTGLFFNRETGRAYIRKLQPSSTWILNPVNGQGEPITIDSHNKDDTAKWIRFGYILTKIRD